MAGKPAVMTVLTALVPPHVLDGEMPWFDTILGSAQVGDRGAVMGEIKPLKYTPEIIILPLSASFSKYQDYCPKIAIF